jgi:hypothetical protein
MTEYWKQGCHYFIMYGQPTRKQGQGQGQERIGNHVTLTEEHGIKKQKNNCEVLA